jgi:hypothetical protein
MSRRFVPTSTITRRMDAKDARIARALRARQLLAPEGFPYASVEIVSAAEVPAELLVARKTDSVAFCATCDGYAFAGHVCPQTVAPVLCPWCPGFDRTDPIHRGRSHGICDACRAVLEAELDAERDADQAEEPGSRCGAACGHCGRCS